MLALAKASNCPRRKFGALLVDPERNVVLMDGYNGGPRGGGTLCGGDVCLRDTMNVKSGTRVEIGCHHAEMNLIYCAAANGGKNKGCLVTCYWRTMHDVCKTYAPRGYIQSSDRLMVAFWRKWIGLS